MAEIASRRWDLHSLIAVHPQAYPALRQWIAQANPNPNPQSAYPTPGTVHPQGSTYPTGWARPQRSSNAGWFVGCGCLALAALVIGVLVIGAMVTTLSSDGVGQPDRNSTAGSREQRSAEELLAPFNAERKKYRRLVAALDGNPVAPLVTHPVEFARLEKESKDANFSDYSYASLAQQTRRIRRQLQRSVTAAEKRRVNRSGSLTEELVDRATNGFIDTRWDAATACKGIARDGKITTGCVKGRALTVHLMPESELDGDWEKRLLVAHELAHVYQRADRARFKNHRGRWDRMVKRGLFQGSQEKMADCYALTHEGLWSLSQGNTTMGYGYVCGNSERQAIRKWAAGLNAPMP